MSIVLQRIYDESDPLGGNRVLVDGVWPRGISKEQAQVDEWMKEISPSKELRQWFDHDPEKYEEFKEYYKEQIDNSKERKHQLQQLKKMAENERLVLLYGAKNEEHNHAIVLKELLEKEQ
ncbi:Uncharacterized conserved protein YeaO, DUF488 family [Thalassobacillus cyri]|uniref:Uncharacterized conserved protein YeaO, DUF488 family n=1 Tax=Thalassobacillus cyri TaxID=571932 RepID=A0A1H4DJT8_9BACI|nr:DUF488 family protein [Thalassobacillus cyri]SEA72482.1 Uncharacterized conserved protein YeaO, DUF488 family [Thalassobacillus cyri]